MPKVLIVDDDNIVLFVQQKMLQRCGISEEPLKFRSAIKALEFLKDESSNKYLIFLDINMPQMTGWDFLDHIQKKNLQDSVRVVMVTSSIDTDDKNRSEAYEYVVDYIEKPISTPDCERIKTNPSLQHFFNS